MPQQKQRERATEGAESGKVSNLQYLHRWVWWLHKLIWQLMKSILCCDAWQSCMPAFIHTCMYAATWHISSCGLWWRGMRAWLMRFKLNWRSHRLMRTKEDHDHRILYDSMTSSYRFRSHILHACKHLITLYITDYLLHVFTI